MKFEPEIDLIAQTKWLRLETLKFTDAKGVSRAWDRCVRAHPKNEGAIDAVLIVATTLVNDVEHLVLVRQFRPALGVDTLEFPAGLVDLGESPKETAVREMREETGYCGPVILESPVLCLSPGITKEVCKLVQMSSVKPGVANPEPEENIEVVLLQMTGLRKKLEEYSKEHEGKLIVFDAVYTFALGLELSLANKNAHS